MLLLGVASVIVGVLFRLGYIARRPDHQFFRRYRNPQLPWWRRHAPFGAIPLGSAFIFLVLAPLFAERGGRWAWVAILCEVSAAAAFLAALRVLEHPPEWSKPDWWREEERRAREAQGPFAPAADGPPATRPALGVRAAAALRLGVFLTLVAVAALILLVFARP